MKHGTDLGILRTFLCVYRSGGVAKAAVLLGLSQPAVSRHLKTLEGIMGRPLFDRLGRGVAPTQAGVLLANQIAAHLDALEGAMDALPPPSATAPVLLGAPSDLLSVHVLPKLTPLLARGVDVHCRIGLSPELAQTLLHDELDLVVVTKIEQAPTKQLHLRHLREEEFVLVGRAGEAPYVPETDTRRFIGYSPTMPMARRYFRTCWGIQPPAPALTVADLRTVVAAVAAGTGLSVVPRYLAQEALDDGRLSLLHTPVAPVSNSIYLATRRGREHLPQIKAAFELLCPAI
ncbi:LysR family transcriptional regulator [Streptomyces olivochromogenes]|uniref:LysR family transcriptional regulator n=1 Tax=Streptomyces olivochromogenes TaxID=1963 RepID=UPI001F16E7A1|nr:LysR family transcriptional regulator [Streptomyces olivochromogenes]MCF3134694.1 LysR family transcriptional regulator [Streptomyces olivochromogenes]